MSRKLHGRLAGPWLGANTVAFSLSGAIVPIIEIYASNLVYTYLVMAGIVSIVTCWLAFGPNPESFGRISGSLNMNYQKALHYYAEYIVGIMVFMLIGGNVTSTSYLDTFVDDTGIISISLETSLVLVLWISIFIGRFIGVQVQLNISNESLPIHLYAVCTGGLISMLIIIAFPSDSIALWIGVSLYGLFNGPSIGYCYDWVNRITYPSENSMSIVMFGLNMGASIVPYITTIIWNHGGGPYTLIYVLLCTAVIPIPLLFASKYASYEPSINPRLFLNYSLLPQDNENEIDRIDTAISSQVKPRLISRDFREDIF